MDIKGEVVKLTGLDRAIVDQVFNALGQIVNDRYPQFAGILGPALGINVTGSASGTAATGTGSATDAGASGIPDLGGLFGSTGASDTGSSNTPGGATN